MQTNYITNSSFPTSLSFVGNINLSGADYTITAGGVYNMTVGSDGGYLYFPNPADLPGARIVITNTGYADNFAGEIAGSYIPKQGATDTNIPYIYVGQSYNYVSDGFHWRNLPTSGITSSETAGSVNDTYHITKAGVYSVGPYVAATIHLFLPNPILLDGQTLKFFNPSNDATLVLYEYPIYDLTYNAYNIPFGVDPFQFLEIISVGGKWRFIQLVSA